MKISKLFHWLYAILMFLPFGLLIFNSLACFMTGNTIVITDWERYFMSIFDDFSRGGLYSTIYDTYDYLIAGIFNLESVNQDFTYVITNLLAYWTCISIIWLIFDVFMYVPLLVHRWIDKAKIE